MVTEYFSGKSMDSMKMVFSDQWSGDAENPLGVPVSNADAGSQPFDDSFRNRTTPKHKASHFPFFTWVAYCRKYSPKLDDVQKRTCPVLECGERFNDPQSMEQHIYFECPHLSKGLYQCLDCEKKEKVTRCHANGCIENRHRARLAAVSNPFRLARRLFPPYESKGRCLLEDASESTEIFKGPAEVHSTSATYELSYNPDTFLSELSTSWTGQPFEFMQGFHIPQQQVEAELTGNNRYISIDHIHLQGAVSELSASNKDNPDQVRAELGACACSTCTTKCQELQQRSQTWQSTPPYVNEFADEWRAHAAAATPGEPSSPSEPQYLPQSRHQIPRKRVARPKSQTNIIITNVMSPLSAPGSARSFSSVSPVESSSSTESPTIFTSSGSGLSTRNSSMSSFGSNNGSVGELDQPYAAFFKGMESEMTFEEPEPIQESSSPVHNIMFLPKKNISSPTTQSHTRRETSLTPLSPSHANIKCTCGFKPDGKEMYKRANLKRHQRTCRRFTSYRVNKKVHACPFPKCKKSYTRSDNLLVHQRNKDHLAKLKFGLKALSPETGNESLQVDVSRYGAMEAGPEAEDGSFWL